MQHICACMHTYVCFLFLSFSLLLPSSKASCDHNSYQCFPVEFPPFSFMSGLDKRPACSFHSFDSSLLVLEVAGPLAISRTPFTSGPGSVRCRCIALALYIVLMKASVMPELPQAKDFIGTCTQGTTAPFLGKKCCPRGGRVLQP